MSLLPSSFKAQQEGVELPIFLTGSDLKTSSWELIPMNFNRYQPWSLQGVIWALKLVRVHRTARISGKSTRSTRGDHSGWTMQGPEATNSYSPFNKIKCLQLSQRTSSCRCQVRRASRTSWCVLMLRRTARRCCTTWTRSSSRRTEWSTTWSRSSTRSTRPCRTSTGRRSRLVMQSETQGASSSHRSSSTKIRLFSQSVR